MRTYTYDIYGIQVVLTVQAPHGGHRDYGPVAEAAYHKAIWQHSAGAAHRRERLALVRAYVDKDNRLCMGVAELRPRESA